MSSAVHSDRAKEQIACKVFIQCIKHTAAQSTLSVPLFFNLLRNRAAWEKKPRHSKQRQSCGSPSCLIRYFHRNLVHLHGRRPRKQVHTAEMTVPKPPEISKPHLCRYSITRPLVCCYGSLLCTVRFAASSHMPSEQVSHMYSRSFPQ